MHLLQNPVKIHKNARGGDFLCIYINIYLNLKHHEDGGAVAALSDQPLLRIANLLYKTWRKNYIYLRPISVFSIYIKLSVKILITYIIIHSRHDKKVSQKQK